MSITTEELVTPTKAKQFMAGNTANRHMRHTHVQYFEELLKNGGFLTTHQGIALAKDGTLLDGQHRLQAIINSGVGVRMLITRGLDKETYKAIDGGAKRTAPDRLKLLNDETENKTCIQVIIAYLKFTRGLRGEIPVDAIEETFLDDKLHEGFKIVASQVYKKKVSKITTAPVGAALATYFAKHKDKAIFFADSFLTGANLPSNSPILALRNALQSDRVDTKADEYWKAISAMRAHSEGRPLKLLVAATDDFVGNKFKMLSRERTAIGLKSAKTKRDKEENNKRAAG